MNLAVALDINENQDERNDVKASAVYAIKFADVNTTNLRKRCANC